MKTDGLRQHPQRLSLHNEIHARPPEAMDVPARISRVVMWCDAAQREASRSHIAALARDHHLPLPDSQSTHIRLDLGAYRLRWELHTEFVTWTFSKNAPSSQSEQDLAVDAVNQSWLAALPGQCLASLHLWVLPLMQEGQPQLVRQLLNEETLVASTVADGFGEVYTDFAVHPDGYSRMVLLVGGMTPRRLGRLVQGLLEIETYRMAALLGLPAARDAAQVLASAERELAELAKQAALSFLDTYTGALPSPADREALHCAARCALRTKLAEPMADALASIVADAVLTVRREGEPIDLHMVEVRREERRGGKK